MLTKKKMLISITMLLIAVFGTMSAVQAIEVYIYTDAEGNITVTTSDEANGTLTIIYNGVDLLAELNSQLETINSQLITIVWLEEQMKNLELNDLNQKILQLIEELNTILEDVYGKVGFLAYVIGLTSNSSTTVEDLKSGDSTIVNYLDKTFANLDETNAAISNLDKELADTYVEVRLAMEAQGVEIENLEEYANELEGRVKELEELTNERLSMLNSSILTETNRQTMMQRNLDVLMALSVFLTIVLAVVATALVYVANKKSKTKPQQLKPKL